MDAQHGRKLLDGVWRLVSYETQAADGTVRYPFGPDATGMIMYAAATGYMSGQMMRPDRPVPALQRRTAAAQVHGTADELRAMLGGYLSYCGSYDVDATAGSVTHHVECALLPEWIGTDLVRYFTIDGDRVTYRTPVVSADGSDLVSVLVWVRVGAVP